MNELRDNDSLERISSYFHPPIVKKVLAKEVFEPNEISPAERHEPVVDRVEPKVYSPIKSKPGHLPRRIKVERTKRNYASFDLTNALIKNATINNLLFIRKNKKSQSIDQFPLSWFDNLDYEPQSAEYWANIINKTEGGLPARALYTYTIVNKDNTEKDVIEWRLCDVIDAKVDKNEFIVKFTSEKVAHQSKLTIVNELTTTALERIYICFMAEDPENYCARIADALNRKQIVNSTLALNLYVDFMPTDNLRPLDSEQWVRISSKCMTPYHVKSYDTSHIIAEYNMNHMRTMNQLSFCHILKRNGKEIHSLKAVSIDYNLFIQAKDIFSKNQVIIIERELLFDAVSQTFKFQSLYSKIEATKVLLNLQLEITNLYNINFFSKPEKTLRIDEFISNQSIASNSLTNYIKDNFISNIISSIKNNFKDIKKGWFNIDESSLEVYIYSTLKRFLIRINLTIEDSIRDLMYRSTSLYVETINKFVPKRVNIVSCSKIDITAKSFPLFVVDLKFINPTMDQPNPSFAFSTSPQTIYDVIIAPFDLSFTLLKHIVQVEKKIMTKLFWSHDPIIRVPHSEEPWAVETRDKLINIVNKALKPMYDYLSYLNEYLDLISIDINQYIVEAEKKYCSNENMNLNDLNILAQKHLADADNIYQTFPQSVNLGMVLVDCKNVRNMLSLKHKNIANKLFQLLDNKIYHYCESIVEEFRQMFDKLSINPATIESLIEMREYLSILPNKIDLLADKITKSENYFNLLEQSKFQTSIDHMDLRWDVFRWPLKMSLEISRQEKNFRTLEHTYKRNQEDEQSDFNQDLLNLQGDIGKLRDFTALSNSSRYATIVRRIHADINLFNDKARLYNQREALFNIPITEYNQLIDFEKSFEPYHDLWDSTDKWLSIKDIWASGPFMDLDPEVVETTVTTLQKNLNKSIKSFDRLNLPLCSNIAIQMRDEVDAFKPKVPLIMSLRNPGMRDRHWEELSKRTNVVFPKDKSMLSLDQLVSLGLVKYMADIERVSEKAGKEYNIENSLNKMTKAWENVNLIIEPYRETGTFILKGIDDYMSLLDEQITLTQAMALSAFKGPFEDRIDKWNTSLQVISEVLDEWVQLQRNWLYLNPIFDSADINKQLPQEGKRFATVDKYWRSTMQAASRGVLAVRFCDDVRLSDRFKEGNKLLELVQKGLADYLETKRSGFSRFYFLSNDELLEILSETKDPLRVQPHLRKCFEGIKSVNFEKDLCITAMCSPENEVIPFISPVDPKNKNIENWMVEVKDAMLSAVRYNMLQSIINYTEISRVQWMQKWAAQCVLNGSQCHWTREVEEHLNANGNKGCWDYYHILVKQLEDMVLLIRGNISKAARVTVGALAVIDVHARDVQQKMANADVSKVTDFDWISQMRYYWVDGDIKSKQGDLAVIMVSSKRMYGNEYLGNTFRLVITPLTDKCYLTLMGALQMILGGAPAGPAGTGKTETTKDLAKALAKQCVVFNCSDGLDYMAMGKFFKGLASSGAWACFDEFNRINIEVLSVIAQQVIHLQGAVQKGEKRTIFEGTDIVVNPEFAVFITMNPGYAGRAELPDNLEALFRPVAMMVPDYGLIGEIMLFSYGYMENRKCSQKMVATFRLCSEQLSSQDHYDYGMRAVKTVITAAGNLKRNSPDENEEALLMRALQDVNVPKFLSHDLPLFYGILSDLFPGVERPAFNYGPLLTALKESIYEKNLQPVQIFLRKNIELYEMICVRHGLMVVGPTGGGKSSNIKVLSSALSKLHSKEIKGERYEQVKVYHLNPKSIKMGQLYGEFDENTHEWQDGILCVIIRQCIKEDNSTLKWILFDGPVDAIWIENMNTVLDDNKKLCLTSGEIIQLSDPMTMMFEPEDLAVASPATVSRCGMIYMEPNSLGYDVLFQSWLNTIPVKLGSKSKAILTKLFDYFVPSLLNLLRKSLSEPLPTVNNCLVQGLLNLVDTFLNEYHDRDDGKDKKSNEQIADLISKLESIFIFSMVWSLCCTVNMPSRRLFDVFIRSEMKSSNIRLLIPSKGLIYDYKFDVISNQWVEWDKTISPYVYDPKVSFSELIVPTKDSIGYTYLLDVFIRNQKHVLMTGPTGTGKTVNILGHLQTGLPEKYVPITMCFSAQTSANQTQDLIDSKCEKRRKGVFGPAAGKEFIIFIDDVNMPMKEEYGAQPPIEILRQWFDSGGWYDRKALELRKIIDVTYVTACGPPGGGRNQVTARFYRHFNIVNYVDMSNESLKLIFSTILTNFLSTGFESAVLDQAMGLVKSTIELYNTILEELRPTPTKPHYTFNLRDISKVFQGLLMCDKRRVLTDIHICRLWVHEAICVFGDRLINDADRSWLRKTLEDQLIEYNGIHPYSLWEEHKEVIYCDFMVVGSDNRIYEEVTLSDLQPMIEDYLSEYNSESKQPMYLVMFKDALLHVIRISRILRQPNGHALLLGVGGSGRQSLTRLATYISNYKLFQIEISKGYGLNDWRDNLKQCLFVAGIQNKPIVFLFNDIQIINETMLEDINGILNSGDVPNLYGPDDLESITTACKPDCIKKRILPTKLNIFGQYILRIKSNIHVVLCMSPLGDAFRNRLRKFPSLVNCCTIDWFMEWPDDALQSVAKNFIIQSNLKLIENVKIRNSEFVSPPIQNNEAVVVKKVEVSSDVNRDDSIEQIEENSPSSNEAIEEIKSQNIDISVNTIENNINMVEEIESKIIEFFQYIHQSIEKQSIEYFNKMKRKFYVTPTSYLELLSTYNKVLVDKRKEVGTLRDRLRVGVDKLVTTEKAVNELQDSLKNMEPQLIHTKAEVESMIVQITKDKANAAEKKSKVEKEEKEAADQAKKTQEIADSAQRDLDEAIPALQEAVECLKELKKSDIDEVKSLGRPPEGVIKTLHACCIMFNIPPEMVNDPDNPGKKMKDYFKPAQKQLLVNANKLLEDMSNYDKDNIPNSIIQQIEPFINDPKFLPEVIVKASKACKAMCMWARAMYKYHQVSLIVEPKKKQLAEAQFKLDETNKVLHQAQSQLFDTEEHIKKLEASFETNNNKKEQLIKDVEQCRLRLERAVKLMNGLGGERTRWIKSCEELTTSYDNLIGDALIAAGSISYLGAFTPDYRGNIIKEWQMKLIQMNIPHNSNCTLRSILSDPIAIRSWQMNGLPQDNHSIENGIIMSKGRRYPLLIDPQGQANRFIKNMGKDASICPNDIDVIKLSDKNYLRTLENGVRFGKWILLENINESIDAALEPLLLQQRFKQGGTDMIKIGDSTIPWNDSFRFFITTKLSNPHYSPEICVKVSLINFAITFTGLEDQLLGNVIVEEMPEEEEKKNSLVLSNTKMRKELQELEDTILSMLSNSDGNILDDEKLIETLNISKVKSLEIQQKVNEAEQTEIIIDQKRNLYRPVSYRGSLLYFTISNLSLIDPMYQYSLQWYRNLFIQAIRLSQPSEDINRRIDLLNEYFTYYIYVNICRSLFEKHKLLFSFLLTIRIQQGDFTINNNEWLFLISGKGMTTSTNNSSTYTNPSPDWIDTRMWNEIIELSTIDNFENLTKDFIRLLIKWKDIYDSIEPHKSKLPNEYERNMNNLQRLCLLRIIRPDKIPDGVMSYVIDHIGSRYVEPPPFDLTSCYKDSTVLTPLLFILSKGSDPTKLFIEFSVKLKMDRKYKMLSLGQGQGPKALKLIEEGMQKGYWILLQNCHLYISWLTELEKIIENFSIDNIHKDFRLWLTSMPTNDFPVSILQSSIKMINEPPKGLKANLKNTYFMKVNNDLLSTGQSGSINISNKKLKDYRKLLFGLSFFHAIVQERRFFGPLGWNIPYEFNDTDYDISRGQLELFLNLYQDNDTIPWKVLTFLTSYINYGGRVTDYIDLRTIDVIMKSIYNHNILTPNYSFDKDNIYKSIDFDVSETSDNIHQFYLKYIDNLPIVASPGAFGMHENAKIASANSETFSMFDIYLLLQSSANEIASAITESASPTNRPKSTKAGFRQNMSPKSGNNNVSVPNSREKSIEMAAIDINKKLTSFGGMFDIENISMLYPVTYEESMNTVLLQECIRYNKLIDVMETTLPLLQQALNGLIVMSNELEAIANAIYINQVPKSWVNVAYPSLKPLSSWVTDLLERLTFISQWIEKGIPPVFWISGFYFPQAFLTGTLQNYARKYKLPIDTVTFHYVLIDLPWTTMKKKPFDGVYIRGLFLEGARWDSQIKSMNDSYPKQLYTDLPVIHLLPQQNRKDPTEGIYRCPVYKILSRRGVLSTTGHSTNFIMWIEVPSNRANTINNEGKADQEEWIRAGVAAFAALMY